MRDRLCSEKGHREEARCAIGSVQHGRRGTWKRTIVVERLGLLYSAVVTNGCVKSLVRGSHVDTESGGRIGHIEDGESVAGSVGGLWAG